MQQYFVPENQKLNNQFHIIGADVKHIGKVMRLRPTDNIQVVCNGTAYFCEINMIDTEHVLVDIIEVLDQPRELPCQVSIALGLLKLDKLEYAIQKLTELGMAEFIPWQAQYSVTKLDAPKITKRMQRWQTIAKEAAEQSKRLQIPIIHEPLTTAQLAAKMATYDIVYVAFEKLCSQAEFMDSQILAGQKVLIVIGPEGGIADQEVALFEEQTHTQIISLGNRILRAETAAIFSMSIMSALSEKIIK